MNSNLKSKRGACPLVLFLLTFCLPAVACAHSASGTVGGLVSGFTHPLGGLDHIVAMVAVGLWGAFLGGRAMWTLPVVFPVVMAVGGALGVVGVELPGVETGIALSGVVLGVMVALAARPPLWVAAVLVGIFAVFHGHAHGTELPPGHSGMLYSAGFVAATGALHAVGIGIGLLQRWPAGRIALRGAGAAVAGAGLYFLWRALA